MNTDTETTSVTDSPDDLMARLVDYANANRFLDLNREYWATFATAFTFDEAVQQLTAARPIIIPRRYASAAGRALAAHLFIRGRDQQGFPLTCKAIADIASKAIAGVTITDSSVDAFVLTHHKLSTLPAAERERMAARPKKPRSKKNGMPPARLIQRVVQKYAVAGLSGESTIRVLNFAVREMGATCDIYPEDLLTRPTRVNDTTEIQRLRSTYRQAYLRRSK